mmetsp:Transcript_102394/g.310831  ORF Transcript_102394/g.310831 Transcript_102394/m.310831 type:complete len:320 (+) Transcript_102394:212-1171(+)
MWHGLGDQYVQVGQRDRNANGHLDKLQECHEEAPLRWTLANRREEVVEVHDGVHGVVHGDEVDAGGHLPHVGVPAIEQHGAVVVPVQEAHLALARHEEDGVHELGVLGVDEERRPDASGPGAVAGSGRAAHRVSEAKLPQHHHEVRQRADRADEGKDCQEEVPHRQGAFQVVWLHVLHGGGAQEEADEVARGGDVAHPPPGAGEARRAAAVEVELRAHGVEVVRPRELRRGVLAVGPHVQPGVLAVQVHRSGPRSGEELGIVPEPVHGVVRRQSQRGARRQDQGYRKQEGQRCHPSGGCASSAYCAGRKRRGKAVLWRP